MGKGGSSTTQQQSVSQSTTVTVQNIIDTSKELEPLERVKLLADVFAQIDAAAKPNVPQTVVIPTTQAAPKSVFSDPNMIALLIAAALGGIIIFKRL